LTTLVVYLQDGRMNDGYRDVQATFLAVAEQVVWATVSTVDASNRPWSRILHPLWERTGSGLVGWVLTRPTPVKRAHLAHSPHVSVSYWHPAHDTAVAQSRAAWADEDERHHAWELARRTPPPLGYDPATTWPAGAGSEDCACLRLVPWRLRVATSADLVAGRAPQVPRSA